MMFLPETASFEAVLWKKKKDNLKFIFLDTAAALFSAAD